MSYSQLIAFLVVPSSSVALPLIVIYIGICSDLYRITTPVAHWARSTVLYGDKHDKKQIDFMFTEAAVDVQTVIKVRCNRTNLKNA